MSEVRIVRGDIPEEIDPPDNPELDENEETFEEAPYGYKADGTPRRKPGRPKGSAATGGRSTKSLSNLKEPLTQRLVEYFGGPLAFVSPIAAAVWEERAERTADAILVLAARSTRWRKWVDRLIAGSAGGDIGITMVGVTTGFLVDIGKISPEGKVQHYYGIDSLYVELYGVYEASQNGSVVEPHGLYAEQ